MLTIDSELRVTGITGGRGNITMMRKFNEAFHATSITGVADDGGHGGSIERTVGKRNPGDATHQIAAHIDHPLIRMLFNHRWEGNHELDGHRTANEFLALADEIAGSHSEGIKLIEEAFRAHYRGRVIPISNDPIALKVNFEDGTSVIGEHHIDELTAESPAITNIELQPSDPKPNEEALEHIANADILLLPPGTLHGSLLPILQMPGVKDAIKYSKRIVWFCNAVTTPETKNLNAVDMAKKLVDPIGRPIDFAFINEMDHELPEKYLEEGSEIVENGIVGSSGLIRRVYHLPLTRLELEKGRWVIRHDGDASFNALVNAIKAA